MILDNVELVGNTSKLSMDLVLSLPAGSEGQLVYLTAQDGANQVGAYVNDGTAWIQLDLGLSEPQVVVTLSLLSTNGLTVDSYTASSVHSNASASIPGGFDGHGWQDALTPIEGAVQKYSGGAYIAATDTNEWVAIDFIQPVVVTEFDVYAIQVIYDTYGPKDVELQYSDDGTSWTTHEAITLPLSQHSTTTLATPTPAKRHFRLLMLNTQGDGPVQFDNLVLKGYSLNSSEFLVLSGDTTYNTTQTWHGYWTNQVVSPASMGALISYDYNGLQLADAVVINNTAGSRRLYVNFQTPNAGSYALGEVSFGGLTFAEGVQDIFVNNGGLNTDLTGWAWDITQEQFDALLASPAIEFDIAPAVQPYVTVEIRTPANGYEYVGFIDELYPWIEGRLGGINKSDALAGHEIVALVAHDGGDGAGGVGPAIGLNILGEGLAQNTFTSVEVEGVGTLTTATANVVTQTGTTGWGWNITEGQYAAMVALGTLSFNIVV